ncbi:MAG: mechanosensitive ion channel family protein [Acidimicrobiales bacterium]
MDLKELGEAFGGQGVTSEHVVAAVVLIVIGVGLAWLVRRWSRRLLDNLDAQAEQLARLAVRVTQVLVVAVFVGWALTVLGAQIGWLTLMIVAAGFIAALAARPVLEGLGAAAAITTRPAFSIGDEIAVDDALGEVVEITSRSTVISVRDGRLVHIPNVEMLRKTVTVYTANDERRSSVEIRVGFNADVDRARKALSRALAEVDSINRVGSIRVRMLASSIELSIRFWHSSGIEAGNDATDAAVGTILATLDEEGIDIGPPTDIAITDHHQPGSN